MKKFILIATVALSAGALSSATNKNENKTKRKQKRKSSRNFVK